MSHTRFRRLATAVALGFAAAATPLAAQQEGRTGLYTGGLAGQSVAALPLTALTRDPSVADAWLADRAAALARADSLIGEALLDLAPEVNWVLTPELRRMARRSGGMLPDPDRMGHAVLRNPGLKTVPDPLRSSLRTLVAIAGGRFVFIPAALAFSRDEEGAVRTALSVVLADGRTGRVVWRAEAVGSGPAAEASLRAAVESFLPRPPGF